MSGDVITSHYRLLEFECRGFSFLCKFSHFLLGVVSRFGHCLTVEGIYNGLVLFISARFDSERFERKYGSDRSLNTTFRKSDKSKIIQMKHIYILPICCALRNASCACISSLTSNCRSVSHTIFASLSTRIRLCERFPLPSDFNRGADALFANSGPIMSSSISSALLVSCQCNKYCNTAHTVENT